MKLDGVAGPAIVSEPESLRDTVDATPDWSTPFKEQDQVTWLGATGKVTKIDPYLYSALNMFPIEVTLDSGRKLQFMADGKYVPECTHGVLELMQRPEKVPVKKWVWVYKRNGSWIASATHWSERNARDLYEDFPHQKVIESEIEEMET